MRKGWGRLPRNLSTKSLKLNSRSLTFVPFAANLSACSVDIVLSPFYFTRGFINCHWYFQISICLILGRRGKKVDMMTGNEIEARIFLLNSSKKWERFFCNISSIQVFSSICTAILNFVAFFAAFRLFFFFIFIYKGPSSIFDAACFVRIFW